MATKRAFFKTGQETRECSGGKGRREIGAWNVAIEMQRSLRGGRKKKSIQPRMLEGAVGQSSKQGKAPLINLNYMSSLGFIEAGDSIGSFSPLRPVTRYLSSFFCDGHRNNTVDDLARLHQPITHGFTLNPSEKNNRVISYS